MAGISDWHEITCAARTEGPSLRITFKDERFAKRVVRQWHVFFKNNKMKSQIETYQREIEIHKEVEKELAKRSHFCQKVIKRLKQEVSDLSEAQGKGGKGLVAGQLALSLRFMFAYGKGLRPGFAYGKLCSR